LYDFAIPLAPYSFPVILVFQILLGIVLPFIDVENNAFSTGTP
jgi:hypothetical protein